MNLQQLTINCPTLKELILHQDYNENLRTKFLDFHPQLVTDPKRLAENAVAEKYDLNLKILNIKRNAAKKRSHKGESSENKIPKYQ